MATAGLKGIKTIRDLSLEGKTLFLRLDLNVPIKDGRITDETRLRATLPTIQYAMEKGAKIVMASHLGRPKGAGDKEFSLEPVATRMSELLGVEVLLFDDPASDGVKNLLTGLKKNQIILLENVRYVPGETKDAEDFATVLASYSDVYVNDAFGASHRAHATIHALPRIMKEKGIGFLIEKEITMLDQLINNPKRPYLAILGGSKVSDKIGVLEKLMDVVDGFLIGGAMAYTFLKAQNHAVGKSLVEEDRVRFAREMIARVEARDKSFLLPVDHRVTKGIKDTANLRTTTDVNIKDDELGVDIGPKTLAQFSTAIREAGTIFWNGPMGIFETPEFSQGTFGVAKAIAESNAIKIVGGGDSAAAAEASGQAEGMTHISTGGGASLEYLQGDKLPGLEILRPQRKS